LTNLILSSIASLGNAFSLTITMIFVSKYTNDDYMFGAIGEYRYANF